MGFVEDSRQLLQDFIAPELRSIDVRLATLEEQVEENERKAEKRHDEVLNAIRRSEDLNSVLVRLARLEAKQAAA